MKLPRQLVKEWKHKLLESGFEDIEDDKGRLRNHNRRTKLFETREATKAFYGLLDTYMNDNKELTRLEKRILELYSEGTHLNDIAFDVYRSLAYVKNVVYRHRDIILNKYK